MRMFVTHVAAHVANVADELQASQPLKNGH
jgi:hypothetical protein